MDTVLRSRSREVVIGPAHLLLDRGERGAAWIAAHRASQHGPGQQGASEHAGSEQGASQQGGSATQPPAAAVPPPP